MSSKVDKAIDYFGAEAADYQVADRIVCSPENMHYDMYGMDAYDLADLGLSGLFGVHIGDPEDWLCILAHDGLCDADAYLYEIDLGKWNETHPDTPFYIMDDPHVIDKTDTPASFITFSELPKIPADIVKLIRIIPEQEVEERCAAIEDTYDQMDDEW